MQHEISRRQLMKSGLLAGALAPVVALVGTGARAAELTPLDPNDPLAKSLHFTTDGSKVNASANPTFKAGQRCATCAQFQGKPTDARAGCTIFAGHSVPAGGWCQVWAQRNG
jgi:High potential iron-sulfur protein